MKRESVKAVLGLLVCIGLIVSAMAWFEDPHGFNPLMSVAVNKSLRIGGPIVAVLAFAGFLKLQAKKDLVPDYLKEIDGSYFNRDGFCFLVELDSAEGVGRLRVWFQNQYEKTCLARIALRPEPCLIKRVKMEPVSLEISCDGAAFGVATLPVSLPAKIQGKRQKFEVVASSLYPFGRGKRLRFRDGLYLRNEKGFRGAGPAIITGLGALAGMIVFTKPAYVIVTVPPNVSDDIRPPPQPEFTTFWRLGDEPLEWKRGG